MRRHGLVIVVVLMVIVAMAVGLTAMIGGVRGQSDVVFAEVEREAYRRAGRSAVLSVMAEIWADRDRVLSGESPTLESTSSVLAFEDGSAWERTLVAAEDGATFEPMSARIDVNNADRAVLDRFLAPFEGAADAIVGARPFRSPGQISSVLREAGVSEEDLAPVLLNLTVASWDSPVRGGIGGVGRGEPRLKPGEGGLAPSSLSAGGVVMFEQLTSGDFAPSTRGEFVRRLEADGVPMEDWPVLLDSFAIGDGSTLFGLVDLNRADADVLAALPGLDVSMAGRLVDRRETLSPEQRGGVVWPVSEGLLDVETYAGVVDRLTARSLQYGVHVRVSKVGAIGSDNGEAEEMDAPSADRVIAEYEVVVDISGTRARVVYVREVTDERWRSVPEASDPESAMPGEEADILRVEDEEDVRRAAEPERESDVERVGSDAESGAMHGWGRWRMDRSSLRGSDAN